MEDYGYPLVRAWEAPCERCGETVTTDQYVGGPYFGSGCECGGRADETRTTETVLVVW